MTRPDLLALTPDALAALANRGLVKRAAKELDAGVVPALDTDPAGAVQGKFPDGTTTTHLTGVELGWINLFEGRARRVSVGDGGAYAPGDFARGPRGEQQADPALLSIAEGGLYLRLHHAPADNQPTLFFDGQHVETVPAIAWPTVGVRGTHSEMAHVDGQHVPLLLIGRGSAVVRASLKNGQEQLEAFANGALDPARFGIAQSSNIAYSGLRAGQVTETFDSASARAEAKLFLFRAQGAVLDPPIDVPTQLSLAEKVERCQASVEAATDPSTRTNPSSRCSGAMCWCASRSASSAA